MFVRIAVVFGGKSTEHEVSQRSARNIYRGLISAGYEAVLLGISHEGVFIPAYLLNEEELISANWESIAREKLATSDLSLNTTYEFNPQNELFRLCNGKVDLVFLACHGNNCEDGNLQGFLELCDIPYTGADVLGSAIGMDKKLSKQILQNEGIAVLPYLEITHKEYHEDSLSYNQLINEKFNFPIFVKPSRGGSSVGTAVINKIEDLELTLLDCFNYDSKLLLEPFWEKTREIEVAVLGNNYLEIAQAGEIIKDSAVDYYDYETKYLNSEMSSLDIPAKLSDEERRTISDMATRAYKLLQCKGYARVDFFLNDSGEVVFNEINTLPGFTEISLFAKAFYYEGYTNEMLLRKIVDLAIENYHAKKHKFTYK